MPMPKGHKHTEEAKAKMSLSRTGKHPSEETRRKLRNSPTRPELKLRDLLDAVFPGRFYYFGDRKHGNICGLYPDFVSADGGKLIVELYGCYWHAVSRVGERDKARELRLQKAGYEVLVVWENELSSIEPLVCKLKKFCKSNNPQRRSP